MKKSAFYHKSATLIVVILLTASSLLAQTTSIRHIVDRGETIESIAEQYNVTKALIIEHNPQAAQYIYVGMELQIPIPTNQSKSSSTTSSPAIIESDKTINRYNSVETPTSSYSSVESTSDYPKWGASMEIGYGFLDGKNNPYTYEATIGANYNFTQNFFLSMRIGYNSFNSHSSQMGITHDLTGHILRIPLEIGYKFMTENRKLGVIPFAGLGMNIGLSGKNKINNEKHSLKMGGKLGVDAVVGLRIYLWEWTITGSYHIPVNDRQEKWFGKDAYPMVSLGFTI